MRYIIILSVFLGSLVSSCGYLEKEQLLEDKKRNAIQFIREYHSGSKNPVVAKSAHDVLAALNLADAVTLKVPSVASAIIVQDENQACRLHLYWIEKNPSIGSVELRFSTNSTLIFQVPDSDINANLEDSKRTVLFTTGYNWGGLADFAKYMSELTCTNELGVRLLQAGKPVTGWASVDFYKINRWVTIDPNSTLRP